MQVVEPQVMCNHQRKSGRDTSIENRAGCSNTGTWVQVHSGYVRSDTQHNKRIHKGNPFRGDATDIHQQRKITADIIFLIQETDLHLQVCIYNAGGIWPSDVRCRRVPSQVRVSPVSDSLLQWPFLLQGKSLKIFPHSRALDGRCLGTTPLLVLWWFV